jgi:predicted PurR-regulated permease PerM
VALRLAALLKTIQLPRLADLAALPEHPFVVRLIHKIPPWIPIDRQWLQEQGLALAQRLLEKISELLASFIGQMPGLLLGLFVVMTSTYFLIVDGNRFTRLLLRISPLPVHKSAALFNAFANSCRGVVLGMLAACTVQGLCIAIFFAITDIPNSLLWGLTGVIMGMVPLIGVAPILIGGVLYLFLTGQVGYGIVMLVGSAITATADNVVRPWVLKGHGEMHPLLGLVSALGAVAVFGPTGIILGPIIAAVFTAFLGIVASDLHPSLAKESEDA